jgi:hypothetical protein
MPVPGQPHKCTISVNDTSRSTHQDESKDITLADQDNGQCVKTITMQIVSEPKNGELKPTGTNQFTYTPNTGFIGSDSFQYQSLDNNGS